MVIGLSYQSFNFIYHGLALHARGGPLRASKGSPLYGGSPFSALSVLGIYCIRLKPKLTAPFFWGGGTGAPFLPFLKERENCSGYHGCMF